MMTAENRILKSVEFEGGFSLNDLFITCLMSAPTRSGVGSNDD